MDQKVLYKLIEKNTILRVETGSKLYGLSLDSSDRDEMGVCIEPYEMALGFSPFEQLEWRDAAVREGKHDAPSQPGDLDLKVYSLRKFLRLALKGNPAIMELFFVPGDRWVLGTALGSHLQELAPRIVSKAAGAAYLGYMTAQRSRMTGERGGRHGQWREDEVGYDTKYAVHMLRLGYQGVELLRTGVLSLPLQPEPRGFLLSVRRGERTLHEVLTRAGELERELKDLYTTGPLPGTPDESYVEAWMLKKYWFWWKAQHGSPGHPLYDRLPFTDMQQTWQKLADGEM